MLIIVASALGCVSQPPSEVTPTPGGTSVTPTETPASVVPTSGGEDFGTQNDINSIDSLLNDSSMDISLSDATI